MLKVICRNDRRAIHETRQENGTAVRGEHRLAAGDLRRGAGARDGRGGEGGHDRAYRLRTGADGTARFKVTRAGRWYVSLIHMQKVDDPEAHYESNWATATLEIR